jgi:hypothetical protein
MDYEQFDGRLNLWLQEAGKFLMWQAGTRR